jgi:hypothetical protein
MQALDNLYAENFHEEIPSVASDHLSHCRRITVGNIFIVHAVKDEMFLMRVGLFPCQPGKSP